MKNRRSSLKRRTAISASVVALQIVMTVFFLFDLAIDVRTGPVGVHFFFECMASLGMQLWLRRGLCRGCCKDCIMMG